MNMLFNIIAHAYDEQGRVICQERTFSFIRPGYAKKPTFTGAARMVAKELEVKPSAVSVTRIEAATYLTK